MSNLGYCDGRDDSAAIVNCERAAHVITDMGGRLCLGCLEHSTLTADEIETATESARKVLAKMWAQKAETAAHHMAARPSVVRAEELVEAAQKALAFAVMEAS